VDTKRWGPIHGTPQSSRLIIIDGKTMMQLAQEIFKKNLERKQIFQHLPNSKVQLTIILLIF
jgi:hypothetical protein